MKSLKTMFSLILVVAALAGCSSTRKLSKPVFWPPEPGLPRIQYLKSIGSSADVVEKKKFSMLALGEEQNDAVPIMKPYGIATKGTKIYVCDTIGAEVLVIDLKAKTMNRLSGNKSMGRLKKPFNVAVDSEGNLYVADPSRQEVVMFDADGGFKRTYGTGLGMKPVDVAVDAENVYILDVDHSRIQVLDKKGGGVVNSLGQANAPEENLSVPTNMAMDEKGFLYVTNFGTSNMVKLDRDGHFISAIGRVGLGLGQFGRPKGITVDNDGIIYVVDNAAQTVHMFDDQLRLLMFFGTPGVERGFLNIPAGIAVSTDDLDFYQQFAEPDFILEKLIYVVSQFGDDKINIYGLGKKKGIDYEADIRQAYEERQKLEEKYREEAEKLKQAAEENPIKVETPTPSNLDEEIEKARAAKRSKAQ